MSGKVGSKLEAEFKAISTNTEDKHEGELNRRILCYICGGTKANWSLCCKEDNAEASPYFPFLQSIDKAEGAHPIRSNGRIDACTLCFSFLVQQWHSYEESNTPIAKRTYWLKRAGCVNSDSSLNFNDDKTEDSYGINPGENLDCDVIETETNFETENVNDVKNTERTTSPALSGQDEREIEKKSPLVKLLCTRDANKRLDEEISKTHTEFIQKGIEDIGRGELCCCCGQEGGSIHLCTVNTKPQLKTETPFFPFLSQLSRKVDFMGKVKVCKVCKLYLFQQWEEYEKLATPLSERHYTLAPACDSHKKDDLSICLLCNENCLKSSRNVRLTKGMSGEPYFPSLLQYLPAAGVTEMLEAGVLKVCKSCHKSLTNQWNAFEEADLSVHEREYNINKDHTNDKLTTMYSITCSKCKKLKSRDQFDSGFGKQENAIVSSLGPSPVCCDCQKAHKRNSELWNHKPAIKLVESSCRPYKSIAATELCAKTNLSPIRHGAPANSQKLNESLNFEICFLCGERVNALNLEYLYVYPRQYLKGFKPFFPSLAYRVPAYHAKPPSPAGTVITCTYCHGNMVNQWYELEKHEQRGISNPWVRQYVFNEFTCYLCSETFPRQKVSVVSSSDFPFLTKVRRPSRGFKINKDKDYVVCQHCKDIIHIQKENFDKCEVVVSERDYELPMVHSQSKSAHRLLKKRKFSETRAEITYPVVVIGDSEPEVEDVEAWKREEKPSVINVVTSSRISTGGESLHVSVTQKSSVPMSSPTSGGQNSSFAAALRKLAEQAMSPGSQSPVSVLPPPSNTTLSPVKSNGCESPNMNGVPKICKKEIPDTSYLNSKENRVHPNLPSSSELPGMSGHQVVPGVFSLGPRGYEAKPASIEDLHAPARVQEIPRIRAVHPPHHTSSPFYMPFMQRPAVPDSMYLPPFSYYPPPMMDAHGMIPPGFDHEVWRKRRALEHMRQQHERHSQFYPPPQHDRPLYIVEQDHLKPLSVQASIGQRTCPGDLPPRGERNPGKSSPRLELSLPSDSKIYSSSSMPKDSVKAPEIVGSRSPRSEPLPTTSSLIRQPGTSTASVIISNPHSPGGHQTPLRSPSREGSSHSNERNGENVKDGKQRDHQLMWTRRMFEQKRRLRQEEIEWQHRQQQVRQQKREVQQELFQFRQKLLQQKELEKDDKLDTEDISEQKDDTCSAAKEGAHEGQRMSVENKLELPQYAYPPIYHDTPQQLHMSGMFSHSRLPHHELFFPTGYLPQASFSPRIDPRVYKEYKEYIQQPPRFMNDNKAVSEWLEKQRHPGNPRVDAKDRFVNGEVPKDRHEPQKLKFLKDLGLMTVSERRDRPETMFSAGKRKFPEDAIAQDESNKENRVENGEVNVETGTKKSKLLEEDTDSTSYCKKIEFLSNVGLVTHRKRKELEDDFEKSRWERRHQRLQKKSRKSKKEKKEEKSRSRTPLDLDVSGPMTRQKQQLLQEYGLLLPIKDAMEKESSSSPDSNATADRDSVQSKDSPGGQGKKTKTSVSPTKETSFHNTYEVSTPPPRPTTTATPLSSGPQLTLQSLTHMENPYRAFPSAFHPPFYTSGLLSVHQEHTGKDPRIVTESSSPSRTGSKTYPAIVPGNIGVYRGNGAETRPSWILTEEPLKWPGTRKVIQSYLAYHQDQDHDLDITREKEEKLRLEHATLSDESERLNSAYSELMMSKQRLTADRKIMNAKLERLRNFLVLVQNRLDGGGAVGLRMIFRTQGKFRSQAEQIGNDHKLSVLALERISLSRTEYEHSVTSSEGSL